MPLITPKPNESQNKFISRCMSNETMKKEFPDQKQRTAVCFSQFRKKKSAEGLKTFHFTCKLSDSWEEQIVNKAAGTKAPQRFVETIVSGLKEDRDGERMSQNAINSMVEQFKSGTIPFFPDHGRDEVTGEKFVYSWKQMMGVWIDGKQEGDHLKAVVRLNMEHPDQDLFWRYVHVAKMPIGFSIGGQTSEPKEIFVDEEGKEIVKAVTYNCECIECGYKIKSTEHCANIKCPKCGGQMRRAERPGPGQKSIIKAKVTNLEAKRRALGMSVSQFYAAPRDPPSKSALPIFDAAHTRNAMARFNQTHFLSSAEKAKARRKIIAAARKFKIDSSGFEEKTKK